MKQLLLRVGDDLHARLVRKAKREHRSINSVANEILNVVDADEVGSEREKVRARMAALGVLVAPPPPSGVTSENIDEIRERALESMRGIGPVLDDIINEDRDRL
jgi:hypothetical protein